MRILLPEMHGKVQYNLSRSYQSQTCDFIVTFRLDHFWLCFVLAIVMCKVTGMPSAPVHIITFRIDFNELRVKYSVC